MKKYAWNLSYLTMVTEKKLFKKKKKRGRRINVWYLQGKNIFKSFVFKTGLFKQQNGVSKYYATHIHKKHFYVAHRHTQRKKRREKPKIKPPPSPQYLWSSGQHIVELNAKDTSKLAGLANDVQLIQHGKLAGDALHVVLHNTPAVQACTVIVPGRQGAQCVAWHTAVKDVEGTVLVGVNVESDLEG